MQGYSPLCRLVQLLRKFVARLAGAARNLVQIVAAVFDRSREGVLLLGRLAAPI